MSDKKGMTRSDLTEMIGGIVNEAVGQKVDDALAPMQEKLISYGDKIQTGEDVRPEGPKSSGMGAARMFRALAATRGDPERAAHFMAKAYDDALGDRCQKALAAGDFTAGSFMIPEDMSREIIELLRAATVVRAAGARTIPMPRGTVSLPRQTGDITASYVGENQDITASEPTGGQLVLTAKKLAALVPISRDLLSFDIGDQADMFVRDSMVEQIAVREDQAFIRDSGSASTPKGLRFWAQNVQASNGTSAANIEADFKDAINYLESANVNMRSPVWLMHPRSKNHLLTLRDANGNLIYPELRTSRPTIHTFPIFLTTSIPTNLGGGTETEVYMANMSDVIIGEAGDMEISVNDSASYLEGGSLVSAFSRDQVVVRAITKHDLAVRHDEAVAVINAITWGA